MENKRRIGACCLTTTLIFLLISLLQTASAQDRFQLKLFRLRYVGQRVYIHDNFLSGSQGAPLVDWRFVREADGTYERNFSSVPSGLVGSIGTIIAVQAPDESWRGEKRDNSDDAYVDYGEAIIKLDSGELLATTVHTLTNDPKDGWPAAFFLESDRKRHKEEAERLAKTLTGKSLYLTRLTKIYDTGLSDQDLFNAKSGQGSSDAEILSFPVLVAIPVLAINYLPERDYIQVLIQLPDGRKAQYIPGCVEEQPKAGLFICAMTHLPPYLTPRELKAVREGRAFVGMSGRALFMALGRPRDVISSTRGRRQLMYFLVYVYVDKGDRVVAVRNID